MWYSPEHFIAFSSLFLLTPATLPRDPGAGGAHVTACDASVPRLPPSVQLEPGLEPIVRRTLEHSPTFRRQCRALASAPDIAITVEVAIRPVGIYRRASGLLRVMPSGGLVGAIEIYAPTDLPELLGHELEHVIEQLDGIDLARAVAGRPCAAHGRWLVRDRARGGDRPARLRRGRRQRAGSDAQRRRSALARRPPPARVVAGQTPAFRSAILIGRPSSQLLRAAMPVRHDIAPARESGSRRCAGASTFLKIRSLRR